MSDATTVCARCGHDRPASDKYCRYCGVESDKPQTPPVSPGVWTAIAITLVGLGVLTGIWLQTHPAPVRTSEVRGQRQSAAAIDDGVKFTTEGEAAIAKTESLLNAATGDLVIIPPEKDVAVILSGESPRRRIELPPASHWQITNNALVGFTDGAPTKIVRFATPGEVIETKAENIYLDLDGELIQVWQDREQMRVIPLFVDANATGGYFLAAAPIVPMRQRTTGPMIGPLLTTYAGDTYGWSGNGEWERVAAGIAAVGTDPVATVECRAGEADNSCLTRLVNPHSGQERFGTWSPATSTFQFISQEGGFPSPDLAYVLTAAGRTLVDTASGSTLALSVPSRSRDNTATWALDSSMVGIAGEGLRLFDTRGRILVDSVAVDTNAELHRGEWVVTARFIPVDAFGAR